MTQQILATDLEMPFEIRHLNRERVRMYAEIPDELPPVLVFKVGERYILADGKHRVTAWASRGRLAYPAKVKVGTMEEAELEAGKANLEHGQPLTREERRVWAEKMVKRYGSQRGAARMIGVPHASIQRWLAPLDPDQVKKQNIEGGMRFARSAALAHAPEKFREPLRAAAKARSWTAGEIGAAVEAVQDHHLPAETRKAILTGAIDPVVLNERGEPTYHQDTVARAIKDAKQSDPRVLWYAAREAQVKLMRNVTPEQLVNEVGQEARAAWIVRDLRDYIAYLERFMVTATNGKLRVMA